MSLKAQNLKKKSLIVYKILQELIFYIVKCSYLLVHPEIVKLAL